ncbi:hypothetical protein LO80_07775 [Candidatus Francisella endociliophora]|uniref:Uncharacterized protein n=1 Tax=Candidatus Francisella endociliophora TaxID=653937 RepID=A0A097EQN3_9GAMM|nr:hypothetical protein [Francisella sp. FSC1006]AIT09878.1 hypothetical protein LO80_07775 [Francisella sp. FSC1006]
MVGLAQKEAFESPDKDQVYFFQFKWGMCIESLGFTDPKYLVGVDPKQILKNTIGFLSTKSNLMKTSCVGDGYENMPIPKKI